ncbi:MAG: hypothetical protein D6798_06815 [Deltaproteobacteria bacterium]|nr:MAG: hypothetical protein D6798_06815 [Deltaproteobacteria bacterium]
MKCFNVVQQVLDTTYAEIPGNEGTRDAAIREALKKMSNQYRTGLLTSGGPDFSDPVTRFAYVYLYVPAHAHWLYELITWSSDVQGLFQRPRLRMTCLGGGPGSDLVGALKYIDERNASPTLFCEIVDGCVQWKQTWSDLAFTLDWSSPLHTDYVIHDAADPSTWSAPCNIAKADLFTINFFASEIYHCGDNATDYIAHAFAKAKSGALVLMNDNNDSRFYDWFDAIAAAANMETLLSDQGQRKIYDGGEQSSAVGKYAEKFGMSSRLTGQLAWRVLQKR